MIPTNLVLTCSCKNCGATYFAEVITGGIPIDGDSTMMISRAYRKGDIVKIETLKEMKFGVCNCEGGWI